MSFMAAINLQGFVATCFQVTSDRAPCPRRPCAIHCLRLATRARSKMPPLAPPADDRKAGPWPRHAEKALAKRPASFHGHGAAEQRPWHHHLLRQRLRTQPNLLVGVRGRSFRGAGGGEAGDGAGGGRRTAAPSKVLVTVAVQRPMWPMHIMACAEWCVADLFTTGVQLYVREGRRLLLLPSADPSAFGLHYSQFSLQSLEPEKVMELGSRSFFLYPKPTAAVAVVSSSSSSGASKEMAVTPANKPNILLPWLGFMHFGPPL